MNSKPDKPLARDIGAAEFESEVLRSSLPVVAAFWAPWSRPCQILNTLIEDVAATSVGSLKVVKVNADDNPDLSIWYEVQSVPTLLYFIDGTLRAKLVGTASKEAILSKLQSVLHPSDSASLAAGAGEGSNDSSSV